MRQLRIAVSILLLFASLGFAIWSFAGKNALPAASTPTDDPDLPPNKLGMNKESFLEKRNDWTLLRRGYDPKRPFDPNARIRAIDADEPAARATGTSALERRPRQCGH